MTTIVTRAGKGSPLTNNEVDENFVNLNTAKIETLTSTDSSVTITGTGDSRNLSVPVNPNVVSGPASATDNAVARFDTTTGKLVQNSVVTVDDSGVIAGASISGADNTLSNIGNASLTNSAITINGIDTALGGSVNVGTVTSVTGTAPVASTGGATPVISMAAATASVDGYLTSTDWNTFNNKYTVPTQTGNTGKYLTTDGSATSWGTIDLSAKLDTSGSANPTISNTAPTISLTDTDQGVTKKVHHNSGLIGFLGDSAQWIQYTNNSGQINTPAYGWLHDYFVSGVTNCLRSYQINSWPTTDTGNCRPGQSNVVNCIGGGNTSGEQIEVVDSGSTIGIRAVNYYYNCNCNCQCNC